MLVKGDHFGEIGCLYSCRRTASVISMAYNVMSRLTRNRLRQFTVDHPEISSLLKKHVFSYEDKKKKFFLNVFMRIPFLKDMDTEMFHEFMFSLKEIKFEHNEIVLRDNDEINHMIIIEEGELEVYTDFEQNEFVL